MSIDLQALVVINFVVQLLLMVAVFSAVFFVKVKHQLIRHGMIMRVAVPVQIVSIAVVMLPSMLGYIENETLPGLCCR